HLQRDQQGDAPSVVAAYKSFTYASEAANAATTTTLAGAEVFPEPRSQNDPAYSSVLPLHTFNQFFPWQLNQDGTAEETLNHADRQRRPGPAADRLLPQPAADVGRHPTRGPHAGDRSAHQQRHHAVAELDVSVPDQAPHETRQLLRAGEHAHQRHRQEHQLVD